MRVCLALLLAAGAAGANLLRNPGMENWQCDTLLLDWNVEATGVTRVLRESDTIRSGAHSVRLVRLVAGTGNNRGLSQHVLVSPGRAYAYSVAYRDDEPRISLGLFITWRTADSTFISSEPVAYSRDSACWQTVAETADAPANAARADFVIRTYGASGAPAGLRVFCDDAYLDLADPQSETVRIWFTEDSLAARLCGFFNGATSSIDYCCYNSSRTDVTLCLISRRQAGIRIRVITDNSRLGDQWVAYLRGSGITVWTDSVGPNASAYMHNKFAIRDHDDVDTTNDRLWVASYNPNLDETFADHALEIPGPALCRAYLAEFNQMWGSAGRTPKPD
ncbi:hypothetical protein FJY71_08720, partial [candidate division WOR-3 bacterium]|nr:hypothetical protein [candidate division WOR-3 bacterium]